MIVPGSLPNQASPVGLLDPDKQPSQSNLLMAAAEMHKAGRFDAKPLHLPRKPKGR